VSALAADRLGALVARVGEGGATTASIGARIACGGGGASVPGLVSGLVAGQSSRTFIGPARLPAVPSPALPTVLVEGGPSDAALPDPLALVQQGAALASAGLGAALAQGTAAIETALSWGEALAGQVEAKVGEVEAGAEAAAGAITAQAGALLGEATSAVGALLGAKI
jgi:hypothetical protein